VSGEDERRQQAQLIDAHVLLELHPHLDLHAASPSEVKHAPSASDGGSSRGHCAATELVNYGGLTVPRQQ